MKFVVTAGPTREPIDPVRYLSNRSSGKMGYAIAEAALEEKHEVTLISGPVALTAPSGAEVVASHDERRNVRRRLPRSFARCDVLVMCAAVCDYKPAQVRAAENEKAARTVFASRLMPTRDILASLTNSAARLSCRRFRRGNAGADGECAKKAERRRIAT